MIQSMTGYGKAELHTDEGTLTVEIRSVNGKSADISIKSPLLPKDKEIFVRKSLAERLQRGTIDLFLNWEAAEGGNRNVNVDAALAYWKQLKELEAGMGASSDLGNPVAAAYTMATLLRLPDVLDVRRQDVINDENWQAVSDTIDKAVTALEEYRSREGEALCRDVTSRVENILGLYAEVEKLEPLRIDAARKRILDAASELDIKLDPQRFEQEIIFYLEKLDINEEKVRLRQHCKYFMDTVEGEPYPGKKLGFIIQEMGREINTTGSKANDAEIQKLVVRMKDELEKIREQSMNIL